MTIRFLLGFKLYLFVISIYLRVFLRVPGMRIANTVVNKNL